MSKKIFAICSIFCFCLMIFTATAFAKETQIVGGMTADIPADYALDEQDEDSITFTAEDGASININYLKLENGEQLTKEIKEELAQEVCNDKDIKVFNQGNETIGKKSVYVIKGNMEIEGILFTTYIYLFQYKNNILVIVGGCLPKDINTKEKTFKRVIETIK